MSWWVEHWFCFTVFVWYTVAGSQEVLTASVSVPVEDEIFPPWGGQVQEGILFVTEVLRAQYGVEVVILRIQPGRGWWGWYPLSPT
jgi:hypothetical protein